MDHLWIGRALLLSLFGVIFGMILRSFVVRLPSHSQNVFQLYLIGVIVCALVGFVTVLQVFEYFAFSGVSKAETMGIVLVVCFVVLCAGLGAMSSIKRP